MNWNELEAIAGQEVERAMRQLPRPLRKVLGDVPIVFEKVPAADDVSGGIAPDTLGVFDEDGSGLTYIRLWLVNIWDYSEGDEETYRNEVRTTLLHEIGHLVGWDEQDVEDRGLG